MKKVIFVLSFASLGGIEKSLINLLYNFDYSRYSVDIGLLSKDSELIKQISKKANIIDIDCFNHEIWQLINDSPYKNLYQLIKQFRVFTAVVYVLFYFINKYNKNKYRENYFKWLTRKTKKLETNYDIAIAYGGPNELIDFFVCNKINAKKRIGWIHFDVNKFGCSILSKKLYCKYDKICVVSEEGRNNFIKVVPNYINKTIIFYNRILVDNIIEKAEEMNVYTNDSFTKVLTVGRISPEKGQQLAIKTLKKLIDGGYKIHWYFVGDGPDRTHCENLAKELDISEYAFFVGSQINPYVYMKNCNIYVQPSIHEGFCMTLAEALCFKNPIVTTNFTGAKEQLKNRENSIITEIDPCLLANAIIKAIDMKQVQNLQLNKSYDSLDDLYCLLDE